ncbi:unnamed protein product [Nyctereutes procyonoides]|uniref:(raccoon dog) hypothetical protein n=1 Tax=Nyctereutes procyonoides TaxID=34880 RepID=A0A811ZUC7_NYCPR|nr:unnamed protein product [Nyctereutes procyonoides]
MDSLWFGAGKPMPSYSVYIIYFFIGLPANLLALQAFMGRVRQPHPAPVHILLLSPTLVDLLLLLLLLLPFKIDAAYGFRWPLADVLCAFTAYGFYSSIYCSTWLLAGISIERYGSVAVPVQYKLSRKPVYGVTASLFFCLLSFGNCSIVTINFTTEQLAVLLPVQLELCLVLFLIPMVVTIFCYWRFVHITLSRPQLATVTLFNFLVCFGPYNVFLVLRFLKKDSESWQVCAVLLTVRKAFDKRLQSLQSWGTSLAGFCKRRAGEAATQREDWYDSTEDGGGKAAELEDTTVDWNCGQGWACGN